MRLTLPRHRFTLVLPALVVILLAVGAWVMYPRASANQTPAPAEGQGFLKSARRAIAHGRISEAESMAKARPGLDSGAAAVLAELAIRRGKYEEAQALLEPAAAKEPEGEAALALGTLHLQLGRAQEGSRRASSSIAGIRDLSVFMFVLPGDCCCGLALRRPRLVKEANSDCCSAI